MVLVAQNYLLWKLVTKLCGSAGVVLRDVADDAG